jgi:hypothetical protein
MRIQTLAHPRLHPGDPQYRLGTGLNQTRTTIRPPAHRKHDLPAVINIDARHL